MTKGVPPDDCYCWAQHQRLTNIWAQEVACFDLGGKSASCGMAVMGEGALEENVTALKIRGKQGGGGGYKGKVCGSGFQQQSKSQ